MPKPIQYATVTIVKKVGKDKIETKIKDIICSGETIDDLNRDKLYVNRVLGEKDVNNEWKVTNMEILVSLGVTVY